MAGLLLKGGAGALVSAGGASQPVLTSQPAAPTTAQSASQIAFGPQATPVASSGSGGAWTRPGGHHVVLAGVLALAALVYIYRQLPE